MGIYLPPSTLPVIQNTQRPALPPGDVDAYQMARAGFLRQRKEMTKAERKLLMLIADMVFYPYCETCAKTIADDGIDKFHERTNPTIEKLGVLRKAILEDRRLLARVRQSRATRQKQQQMRLRPKACTVPENHDND